MSTHEAIAALPTTGSADKALIRAMATRRFAYCLDIGEAAASFTAVDPTDGTLPLYLIQNGILFRYDSTDSTTANDGVTCLVTSDSKRYKISSVSFPYSVLNSTTGAEPASPTVGDKYRVPIAATGTDWSGQDNKIAIYTARGWVFVIAAVGQMLYDEATDAFWHKTSAGSWTLGFGTQALGAGVVLPSSMSGGGGKVRWFIENQTTNTPPVSPTANVEYIIGSSPTGVWTGKAAQIARYENGAWVYYVPSVGWKVYDKALGQDVTFNGTAWASSQGAWLQIARVANGISETLTHVTGSAYFFSTGTAPSTANVRSVDAGKISQLKASRSGAQIRFRWSAKLTWSTGAASNIVGQNYPLSIAIRRDNDTNAIAWQYVCEPDVRALIYTIEMFATTGDALAHDYEVWVMDGYIDGGSSDTQVTLSSIAMRNFTAEVSA